MEPRTAYPTAPFATQAHADVHQAQCNPDQAVRDGVFYDWRDVVDGFETQLGIAIADIEEREVAGMDVLYFIKLFSVASSMLYDVSGTKIRENIASVRATVCKTLDHYNYDSEKPVRFSENTLADIQRIYESYRKLSKPRSFYRTLSDRLIAIDKELYGGDRPKTVASI